MAQQQGPSAGRLEPFRGSLRRAAKPRGCWRSAACADGRAIRSLRISRPGLSEGLWNSGRRRVSMHAPGSVAATMARRSAVTAPSPSVNSGAGHCASVPDRCRCDKAIAPASWARRRTCPCGRTNSGRGRTSSPSCAKGWSTILMALKNVRVAGLTVFREAANGVDRVGQRHPDTAVWFLAVACRHRGVGRALLYRGEPRNVHAEPRNAHAGAGAGMRPALVGAHDPGVDHTAFRQPGAAVAAAVAQCGRRAIGSCPGHDVFTEHGEGPGAIVDGGGREQRAPGAARNGLLNDHDGAGLRQVRHAPGRPGGRPGAVTHNAGVDALRPASTRSALRPAVCCSRPGCGALDNVPRSPCRC